MMNKGSENAWLKGNYRTGRGYGLQRKGGEEKKKKVGKAVIMPSMVFRENK